MKRERIRRAETALSAGYDSWRDRWFVLWGTAQDTETAAVLERWRMDFPDREPQVLRVELHRPTYP